MTSNANELARDRDAAYVLGFDEISSNDHDLVGGKCASLGEMTQAGVAVPPGFAVTTTAHRAFLDASGIQPKIDALLETLDAGSTDSLASVSGAVRDLMMSHPMMDDIAQTLRAAYAAMGDDLPVAVRSSATAEDLPDASFAGQQDTYLWVVGADEVVEKVRSCWASMFADRAVKYREDNNIPHSDVLMSVVVQKMVNARSSGVAMTLDPSNGDRTKISIDASWGLGETVVSGEVTPDNFLVEKVLLSVVDRTVSKKQVELVPDLVSKTAVMSDVPEERASKPSLSDDEVIAVADLAKRLEKQNRCPQDVEWAIDADAPEGANLFALQSRPETVWSRKAKEKKTSAHSMGLDGIVGALLAPANAAKAAKKT